MSDIESIVLTYENNYRLEFQYYAEFLRYIGVYVYEDFRCDENNHADFNYDKSAFSTSYEIKKKINFQNKNDRVSYLKEFLETVFEYDDFEQSWLSDLLLIYEKHELLQASVTLQYFRIEGRDLVLSAGKQFEDAADELVQLVDEKDYWGQQNVRYAKLYCKQKANLAQHLYDKSVIYYIDKLALEGLSILTEFPNFSNIWVLLGLIYEISKDCTREAIEAYDNALNRIKEQPYASSVYYWKGRKCESDTMLKSISDNSYKISYSLVKKYRNIYKIARIYFDREQWEETIEYFSECIEMIKRKGNYLDALEWEYYFKVSIQMSSVYLKQKNYIKAIVSAKNAVILREQILNGKDIPNEYTAFMHEIYVDNNPSQYIDLAVRRMGLLNAYYNIAVACQECGLQEEADSYWKLYREWL